MLVSCFRMGQVASSDTGRSGRIWTIYSRNFKPSNMHTETDELFLDGYGEDDGFDEQTETISSARITHPSSFSEDDDYPTDSFSANLEISKEAGYPPDKRVYDTAPGPVTSSSGYEKPGHSFVGAYEAEKQVLDARYEPIIVSGVECGPTREDLMRCYGTRSDLLQCRDQVECYSKCARTNLNQRLLK
jgi:hypothetical protein